MASGVSQTVLQGLRWWAQGALLDQAAVELLARSFGGCHLRRGVSWVRPCGRPGWYWLDADADLSDGQEKQVLLLAAALVDGDPWTRRRLPESGRAAA